LLPHRNTQISLEIVTTEATGNINQRLEENAFLQPNFRAEISLRSLKLLRLLLH
jgi:hypothetical protein